MKLMNPKRLALLTASLLVALAGTPASAAVDTVDRIVAVVNDEIILLSELAVFSGPFEERAAQEAPDPVGRALARREVRQKILDEMIADRLVSEEAALLGLNVSEREVDSEVSRIKRENNLDDASFRKQLAAQGMDEKMLRDQLRRIRLRQKVTEVRVQPRVSVSDGEVRKYYDDNFKNDFKVRVRMLSKKFPKAASTAEIAKLQVKLRELRARAEAGEDFGEIAKVESEGSNPTQGGDIGWIMRGDVAEEIEALAFTLEKGQISEPFRLGDGVHLLQVTDKEPLPPKAFAEVEDRIRGVLMGRAGEKEYSRWVSELRAKSFIEIRLDGPVPPE